MPDKIPLGKPLELTDAQLDELAKVTPEDIRKARELWISVAVEGLETLLDTTETVE